jgi:ABC-type bacteriocin/lantibiotic exporter with double-glycine peptidase domain
VSRKAIAQKEPAAEGLSSGTAVPAAQAGKSGIDYDRPPLSVFAAYIRPHRGAFILDMTLSVLAAAVDLIFPYATRGAINRLLPDKLYTAFFTVMAILLAAYLLRAWFQYLITIVDTGWGRWRRRICVGMFFSICSLCPFRSLIRTVPGC